MQQRAKYVPYKYVPYSGQSGSPSRRQRCRVGNRKTEHEGCSAGQSSSPTVPYSAPLAPSENRESESDRGRIVSLVRGGPEANRTFLGSSRSVLNGFAGNLEVCLFSSPSRPYNRARRCSAHQIRVPLLGFLHHLLWTRREHPLMYHPHPAHGFKL
jgi:hypothetical protein